MSNQYFFSAAGVTPPSEFLWLNVTSTDNPVQIAAFTGYFCNGGSQVDFVLPPTATLGDPFAIISNTATFQISENIHQQMRIGPQISTATTGTLTSNKAGDSINFVYAGSNVFEGETPPQGSLTII